MEHKVTLDTPVSVGDIAEDHVVKIELDCITGEADCLVIRKDSGGNVLKSIRFKLTTLSSTDIDSFVAAVITEAQTQSELPAGTVGQS